MAAVALVLAYALPGGAYDVVVRQEFAIAVWWLIAIGYACALLPRTCPSRAAILLCSSLVAYTAWTALSLAWSASAERTTAEVARILGYLGLVALVVSLLDQSTWRAAAGGLAAGAGAVCVLAAASRLVPAAFPPNPFAGVPVLANRLSYPFGYWNAVGAWGAMSAAFGLAWSAHDPRRAARAAGLGLVPVAALVAYLTVSRAAVAGLALGAVAVLALSRHRVTATVHMLAAAGATAIAILAVRGAPAVAHGTGSRGAGGALAGVLAAVVIAAAVAMASARFRFDSLRVPRLPTRLATAVVLLALLIAGTAVGPRLASRAWNAFRHPAVTEATADPASRLTQLGGVRYFYWRSALDAFSAHPLLGTGAGTFEFWWDRHAMTGDFIRNAHSLELEQMAELGLPGLGLVIAVVAAAVAVLVRARRRARRAVTVAAGTGVFAAFLVFLLQASVDWMWQSTAVAALALAGVAVASMRLRSTRPRVRARTRAAVVALAVLAALVELPGLVSTLAIRRSQRAEHGHNASLALSWANLAVGVEPWAASPYEQRGLVLEAAGEFPAARVDLERAVAREPHNFAHRLVLARIESEAGDRTAAARQLAWARTLRPRALVFAVTPPGS